jgi:hypothetical protein
MIRAARAAGYVGNDATLAATASRLMKLPAVSRKVAEYRERTLAKVSLSRRTVLEQLKYALTRQIKDLVNEDGSIRLPHQLPDEMQSIIDSVKLTERTDDGTGERTLIAEYKITPHAIAREQALKHKGLFAAEKQELKVTAGDDWDELYKRDNKPNPIEVKLIEKGVEDE